VLSIIYLIRGGSLPLGRPGCRARWFVRPYFG